MRSKEEEEEEEEQEEEEEEERGSEEIEKVRGKGGSEGNKVKLSVGMREGGRVTDMVLGIVKAVQGRERER